MYSSKKYESDNEKQFLNFIIYGILGLTPSKNSYESSYGENLIKQLCKENSIKKPEFYFHLIKIIIVDFLLLEQYVEKMMYIIKENNSINKLMILNLIKKYLIRDYLLMIIF